MNVRLEKTFSFEAAHRLSQVPNEHKCSNTHGHSFVIEIIIEGEVDPEKGWLRDFHDISKAWEPIHAILDHSCLNDIKGLENPTSENLSRWLWLRLQTDLPELTEIVVHESSTSRCRYQGK